MSVSVDVIVIVALSLFCSRCFISIQYAQARTFAGMADRLACGKVAVVEAVEVATTVAVDCGGMTVVVGVEVTVTFSVNDKVNAFVVVVTLLGLTVVG